MDKLHLLFRNELSVVENNLVLTVEIPKTVILVPISELIYYLDESHIIILLNQQFPLSSQGVNIIENWWGYLLPSFPSSIQLLFFVT